VTEPPTPHHLPPDRHLGPAASERRSPLQSGESLLDRVLSDLQLAVITLIALLAALSILPFSVYRFLSGETVMGVIDLTIVIAIGLVILHTWRSGKVERAGQVMAVVTTMSCLLVCLLYGRNGLLWAYVVFATNFMLTERRVALAANALLLLTIVFNSSIFTPGIERAVFAATGVMVNLAAFIFAHQNANQRQQLVALASRDALTGLRNRLVMQSELTLAVESHRRSASPCGIAMLDLDHFKRINDAFGHEAGDRVLAEFAQIAEANCRKRDRLYRFGGEEFVLLLPNTQAEGLRSALDNIRLAVAAGLRAPDGQVITVSAGAALLASESDWVDWLARADVALYRAKGRGRNCVVLDTDISTDAETDALERRVASRSAPNGDG